MFFMITTIVLAILLVFLVVLLFRRHRADQQQSEEVGSAVTRQHFEIFQSGELNEEAVEHAKRRFRDLFERGQEEAVEASLRPGTQFVYQVRALAEIGTDSAGEILERQLQRRLSDNHIEQTWYWIDLAGSLRVMNRTETLPHLFRCSESVLDAPLGHFFAAETVCFLGFGGYLQQPRTLLGESAMRILQRALEGLRFGVQPHLLAEARIGEIIENLWDSRPPETSPLLVRILVEVVKLLRRVPTSQAAFTDEPNEREAFEWQISRLYALENAFKQYLREAPKRLCTLLAIARGRALADTLRAVDDLRLDAGRSLLKLLEKPRCEHPEMIIDALRWARGPHVAQGLRSFAYRRINLGQRAKTRRRSQSPSRSSVPSQVPYVSLLRSLRGHPSVETERFLLLAAQDWDPLYRYAALGSLGWWERTSSTGVPSS